MAPFVEILAAVCLVWGLFVLFVQVIGISAMQSSNLGPAAPAVTIIRPVKGLEPNLYDCIASTFRQAYPRDKLSIRLCVPDLTDPALPVLRRVLRDFPAHDAQILVEAEDPRAHALGPNPKIRNISRAYRQAVGDVIWVIDCNVWVAPGVLGRMVDRLMGFAPPGRAPAKPFKFVHQMPLVVDLEDFDAVSSSSSSAAEESVLDAALERGGGRLDEMFMATSHVKFYCAINVVSIAPCIVGKSNMFRKSHLDQVTTALASTSTSAIGVDFFSHHICEDHLIGDILWRSHIPNHDNHGILWGDLALQPMRRMSLANYAARRVRWLRARKFTVLAATLVEPGIEALLCSAYLSFAVTTLPYFRDTFGVAQSWASMGVGWVICVVAWMGVDWVLFRFLQSGLTIEVQDGDGDGDGTPSFARGTRGKEGMRERGFAEWVVAWLGREVLALPIWVWAVLMGTTVDWRGKTFKVRLDTTVEEMHVGMTRQTQTQQTVRTPELERARFSKDRQD